MAKNLETATGRIFEIDDAASVSIAHPAEEDYLDYVESMGIDLDERPELEGNVFLGIGVDEPEFVIHGAPQDIETLLRKLSDSCSGIR